MGLYDDFMASTKVVFRERTPEDPKLIKIDEHRYYFEDSPHVVINTSLTDPSPEHAEQCIKDAAYHLYIALLREECQKQGIKLEDIMW